MHGCCCIGFIDFILKGKNLTDFTNLFSPNNFKNNDDVILSYFKNGWMQIQTPNIYPNLNDKQQFRPKKIKRVKD